MKKYLTFANVTSVLMIGIAVILLVVVLRRKDPVDNSAAAIIAQKDSTIKAWQHAAQKATEMMEYHEHRADSLIGVISKSKPVYIQIKNDYEKVPTDVRNLPPDSLLRAILDHYR